MTILLAIINKITIVFSLRWADIAPDPRPLVQTGEELTPFGMLLIGALCFGGLLIIAGCIVALVLILRKRK